jgi:hypothetical protein
MKAVMARALSSRSGSPRLASNCAVVLSPMPSMLISRSRLSRRSDRCRYAAGLGYLQFDVFKHRAD